MTALTFEERQFLSLQSRQAKIAGRMLDDIISRATMARAELNGGHVPTFTLAEYAIRYESAAKALETLREYKEVLDSAQEQEEI